MAIPDRPLNFDAGELTLEQLDFLGTFGSANSYRPGDFVKLALMIAEASDWTEDECRRIKQKELNSVMEQIGRAISGEEAEAVNPTTESA